MSSDTPGGPVPIFEGSQEDLPSRRAYIDPSLVMSSQFSSANRMAEKVDVPPMDLPASEFSRINTDRTQEQQLSEAAQQKRNLAKQLK